MATVAPAMRQHAPHGGRSPRPAKGAADFGRFLQEARQAEPPAADEVDRPGQASAPEKEESAPPPAEGQTSTRAPAGEEGRADGSPAGDGETDTEADLGPETAAGTGANPINPDPGATPAPPTTTTTAQPFVPVAPQPVVPTTPQPFAPVTSSVAPPAPQTQISAAAKPAVALAASAPAADNTQAPAPTPTPAPPPKGKTQTQGDSSPAEGSATDASTALESGEALALEPAAGEDLQTVPPTPNEVPHAPANMFSFEEHLRPDLRAEVAPEPVLDQLQQAMDTALLDENTQLVMPQVVRGLTTLVREGVSEMRLQLMPEDLGEIELRVQTSEGTVRGEMMVQNPEVKHLLDQHLDRLRDALQQQGLDLRGFAIGLSPDGRFAQPDRSRHQNPSPNGTRPQAQDSSPEPAAPVLTPRGAKEVDYLA